MKKSFKSKFINFLLLLLSIVLIVKFIFFISKQFLPAEGVSQKISSEQKPFFYTFKATNKKNAPVKKKLKIKKPPKKNIISIKKFELIALYNSTDVKLATIKYNKKIDTILAGEVFEGYKLISIFQAYIILNKNKKDYKLEIKSGKDDKKPSYKDVKKPKIKKSIKLDDEEFEPKKIERKKIDYYKNNLEKVWKDITIMPNKKGKNSDGFKVLKIKKDSDFHKLGIQKGDIIKEINGRELKSNKDAFYFFKNLDKIDMLQISILRGEEIKEIEYEVR